MSRTVRPGKTKIGTELAHVTRDSDTTFKVKKVKGQGHQAALVGCTTWTYSNGDLSICVHDICRVTTCRPGREHIVAAARLQLVTVYYLRQGGYVFVFVCLSVSRKPQNVAEEIR